VVSRRTAPWTLLAALVAAASAQPSAAARRPNIVLVTMESTRSDHVGCYGYEKATTPALDALAGEGVLFENAYSVTSWTLPSHASIFTGLYPAAHGAISFDTPLDESNLTLAESLAEAGYLTAGFISGPLLLPRYGLHQGFTVYDASSSEKNSGAAHEAVTNDKMEKLLDRFLQEGLPADGRPFFLFAYLWDPHYDYIPPEPFDAMFVPEGAVPVRMLRYAEDDAVNRSISASQLAYVVSQYDGEIRWTDRLLGRLFERLRARGLWEDTAIIVTSDHGEEFFDHGGKGHKNTLYEEVVHVPLVLKPPGRSEPPRHGRLVSLLDLFPTIRELAGLPGRPEERPCHGRSLLGAASDPPGPIFFELQSPPQIDVRHRSIMAIREGDRKLIIDTNNPHREYFDLATDPGEGRPLGMSAARDFRPLQQRLSAHHEAMKRDAGRLQKAPRLELSPEELEQLRSLGYVGGGE